MNAYEHPVFEELDYVIEFYDSIAQCCSSWVLVGVSPLINFSSCLFYSISGTLDSIKTLLEKERFSDVYVLLRKYFDEVLLQIYLDVVRVDKFDRHNNINFQDIEIWLKSSFRIPGIRNLLKMLKTSEVTKDIFPFFGWETYFKNNRGLLDDCIHGNSFAFALANFRAEPNACEVHLKNALVIFKQIFTMHLSFLFHMNAIYMMASDYADYLENGLVPPDGSNTWLAPFAQQAFDRYIKTNEKLANFIRTNCSLKID